MAVRPLLRPGAIVLRRSPSHLQIGLSPGLLVPDRPGLWAFLHLLDGVRDVSMLQQLAAHRGLGVGDVARLVDELLALGAVVDSSTSAGEPRLAVRTVAVDRHSHRLARAIRTTCDVPEGRPLSPDALTVAVCSTEPARDAVDDLVQRTGAVLLVRSAEAHVEVGPFVVAAATPCLRCADDHRSDADPAWPAVLAQAEGRPGPPTPPRLHPAVLWQAAVLVARDVSAWHGGERPAHVGAVTTVGPAPDDLRRQSLTFHPRCLCAVFPAA